MRTCDKCGTPRELWELRTSRTKKLVCIARYRRACDNKHQRGYAYKKYQEDKAAGRLVQTKPLPKGENKKSFQYTACMDCKKKYTKKYIRETEGAVARCDSCFRKLIAQNRILGDCINCNKRDLIGRKTRLCANCEED